ncbi:MAG: phosphoribosyltransferase [bacterium]|nr:phosphoribosyltransferase [bacterium]
MGVLNSEDVFAMTSVGELRQLESEHFAGRHLSEAEIGHIFGLCEAMWFHSGNPEHPHAELTAGGCSDGFIDTLRVLRYTNLCQLFGVKLLEKIRERYNGAIDWVIGSDHAGADLSHSVAIGANAQHDFTVKGPEKTQQWKRLTIAPDEVVLQVEELMTTASTLKAVRQGIRDGNPHPVRFAPVVGVLIHRSDVTVFEDRPVTAYAHYDIQTWSGPDVCPLCQAGSKRIRPKEHWVELARYGKPLSPGLTTGS